MARKKESEFEMLIEIVARFPWWVGVVLAVITYVGLQPFVEMDVVQVKGISEIGSVIQSQMGKALATIGQYLLPGAFIIGAVFSFVATKKRETL